MMLKRFLALLLCLFLLPAGALGEAADCLRFRATFDMNAEAYPDGVQAIVPGLADLVNEMSVEGTLTGRDGLFDLKADLLLSGQERTRTDLRVFGSESNWLVRSSLLGSETLSIDLIALLEFAVKGYSHLGIPFQRVAIMATPYVHQNGIASLTDAAKPILLAGSSSRSISRQALEKLAEQLADIADTDRAFLNWTMALAMETGYDAYIRSMMAQLPAWIDSFVPAAGIDVAVDADLEIWSAGQLTLYRRETNQSGAQALSLTLPPMTDGSILTLEAAAQPDGDLLHISLDLLLRDGNGRTLLSLRVNGSSPVTLPVTRAFSITWDAEGEMIGGDGVHLCFDGEPTTDGVILRQMTPDRSATMLTVTARLSSAKVDFIPEAVGDATSLLNVNSETLKDLMTRIASPLVRGLLPLIAQAPASSCQTVMNLLEDSGVFGLLTGGFESEEGGWDDEWDDWSWDGEEDW